MGIVAPACADASASASANAYVFAHAIAVVTAPILPVSVMGRSPDAQLLRRPGTAGIDILPRASCGMLADTARPAEPAGATKGVKMGPFYVYEANSTGGYDRWSGPWDTEEQARAAIAAAVASQPQKKFCIIGSIEQQRRWFFHDVAGNQIRPPNQVENLIVVPNVAELPT